MNKILLMLWMLASITIFAQKNWTLYKSIDGINIYYKYTECHDVHNGIHKEIVALKFENKTEYTYEVSWVFNLTYAKQDNDKTHYSEQARHLLLKKETTLVFSCNNPKYSVFARHLNYPDLAKLIKFNLSKIKLEKLNN